MPQVSPEGPLLVRAPIAADIPEAIVIMDADLRVLSVNDAFRAITGFSEEDVLGEIPPGLDPRELSGRTALGIAEAIRGGGRWQGVLPGRRRSGERFPLRVSLDPVLGPHRSVTGFVGIFSDTSARERGNAEPRKESCMKVLVIEDAEEVVESIKLCVSIRWPECAFLSTPSGKTGLQMLQAESPDVVILDLALADGYGMDVLRSIRRLSDVPVVIVSAKADEVSRVKGLEDGADDYIVKPFSHTELLARMHAVLRRAHMPELWKDQGVVQADGLTIDLAAGRAYVNGVEAAFSATEWKLLAYLVRNSGKVIPAQALAVNVWGLNFVESSTIKMCIRRLRQKLGDDTQSPRLIRSYRGRGYSFDART